MSRHVLVTGATGTQGGAVARELLARGHRVRAVTRRPDGEAAKSLVQLGVDVVTADFDKPDTVRKAAAGVDAVFAMGTPFEVSPEAETRQVIALIDAVDDAGVAHLVYSSVASALDDTGIPHFESKAKVERHLAALGTPHTVLAPAAFLENVDSPWVAPALREGSYGFGMPANLPLQQVAVADLAAFAALVIEQPERFAGTRVELASVEVTGAELAAALSVALDRNVRFAEVPLDAFRNPGMEDMLAMLEFFRDTGYSVDIKQLHATYPEVGWHGLEDWAREHDWSAIRRAS
ncbi:MAG: NmrA/HSCARG family protein [Nocardioidaceae bacterium]